MVLKLSEQVRRLEDTIESLRRDNQELRDKLKTQEPPKFAFKWTVKELPKKWEDGDLYFIEYSDWTRAEVVWYNWKLEPLWEIKDMYAKSEYTKKLEEKNKSLKKENQDLRSKVGAVAEETIQDLQKTIAELSRELEARVGQVENLQSSYKTLQKENERLKSKLEQTVDEYDEDYQTFHKIKDDDINYDKRLKQHIREIMKSRLDDMFNKWRW